MICMCFICDIYLKIYHSLIIASILFSLFVLIAFALNLLDILFEKTLNYSC